MVLTLICMLAVSSVFFLFLTEKIRLGYRSYQKQTTRIARDAWIHAQCTNPVFLANMRHHSNLCEEVTLHAQIGPVWYALNDVVTSLSVSWEYQQLNWVILVSIATLCCMFPSLIIAHLNSPVQCCIPFYSQRPSTYSGDTKRHF